MAALGTVGATEVLPIVRQAFETAVDDITDKQGEHLQALDGDFYKTDIPRYLLAYAGEDHATIRGAAKVLNAI